MEGVGDDPLVPPLVVAKTKKRNKLQRHMSFRAFNKFVKANEDYTKKAINCRRHVFSCIVQICEKRMKLENWIMPNTITYVLPDCLVG